MQKFLIPRDRISDNKAIVDGTDARHIFRVLRLSTGDDLSFTDGTGTDFSGRILSCSRDRVVVEILDSRASGTESPLSLTVCTGMLKHSKMDDVIQGLTQIGITRWIPFFCERSVPTPDDRALARRMERWQTIANETIKQCRRSRVVEIFHPTTLTHILDMAGRFDHCLALWEQGGKPVSELTPLTDHDQALILIGPEGGFSESEIHQASAKGFMSCSLGPRILRAETASLCAAALVQHRLGDM
jgi:16S rRNA (uracil1498-N3)-methyltransferase